MLADYHVHSDFSWDCQTPMEAQVRAAIGAGWRNCVLQTM